MITSSLAIGSCCSQTQVVRPALGTFETSSPFATAAAAPRLIVDGMSRLKSYVALSAGVLLLGKPVIEPIGWLRNVAPSPVAIQPSVAPSASRWATGVPEYSMTVVKTPSTG